MTITFNFEGKVVLITGSSSGIGADIAKQFSKAGANVVVTGRNAERVTSVAKQCSQVSPKKLKPLEVVADVTKKEDLKRLMDSTIKTYGKLDVLENNAGGGSPLPISDKNYFERHNETLDTNLNSTVYLTHLSVEHLEKTKGNIINISSIAAIRASIWFPSYNVAKAGLDMFAQCMAAELGPKRIRVNVINPGAVKTAGLDGFGKDMGLDKSVTDALWAKYSAKLPVGRLGTGDDIAAAVLFLASEESAYITGANLMSDGGHCAANVDFGV